jgi:hypothetical protein
MTASAALSPVMHLYLDETGARHPDRAAAVSKHGCDWFAIGGLLINEEDIDHAKAELAAFLSGWPQIRSPLHLTDMRSEHKGFAWLGKLDVEERSRFWSEYRRFLARVKVAGTACVIDRPGYVARGYGKREGDAKWLLCRSAFDIVIDRAAKFADLKKRRLRVFYERADPVTDKLIEGYFRNIKIGGLAFDEQTSAKYAPLSQVQLAHLLIGIEGKDKQNKILQIADSYLYAIARGSYQRKFDIYRKIAESGKLVTSQVDGSKASVIGVKTYCFELVKKGG